MAITGKPAIPAILYLFLSLNLSIGRCDDVLIKQDNGRPIAYVDSLNHKDAVSIGLICNFKDKNEYRGEIMLLIDPELGIDSGFSKIQQKDNPKLKLCIGDSCQTTVWQRNQSHDSQSAGFSVFRNKHVQLIKVGIDQGRPTAMFRFDVNKTLLKICD